MLGGTSLPHGVGNNSSFILRIWVLGRGFMKGSKLDSQDWSNSIPLFR